MRFNSVYESCTNRLQSTQSIWLLLVRLVLAYGFYHPAMMKLQDVDGIADWFSSIGIPAPHLSAYLATYTEVLGVILLTLGLGVRWISVPLIITMLVAIKTVHWTNGFEAGNNGFEIPLYYILFLLLLLTQGAGRISLDEVLHRLWQRRRQGVAA